MKDEQMNLQDVLKRVESGEHTDQYLAILRRAITSGQVVLATGERAVALGGDANDAVITTGDNNIITVFKGPDAETTRRIFRQVLAEIESDRYARTLQEYFTALRTYCHNLPYLTLYDIRPPKKLDEVYIPLRLRERKPEHGPGLEDARHQRVFATMADTLSIAEVLQQASRPHLLILGEPGAGKSTLLRRLAEHAWDDPHAIGLERPHLPMLVPLRTLALAGGALEERLASALKSALPLVEAPPAGFFRAWAQRMSAPWLLLLDGLDEVSADRLTALLQWLDGILSLVGDGRVLITARPSVFNTEEWKHKPFSIYDIQPFTPEQTKALAERWFGDEAPDFLRALENLRVVALSGTPLLLTIAAKVYLRRKEESGVGSLPERRSQLYEEFINTWLKEAEQRGLRQELGDEVADVAKPALAHLALAMTEHPDWVDEDSLARVAAKYLREELSLGQDRAVTLGRRFVQVMGRRSGFFIPVEFFVHLSSHGEVESFPQRWKGYSWLHPTFREYLTAWWVVKECSMDPECVWQRAVSRWESERWGGVGEFAIGILSSLQQDVTILVERLLDEEWISEGRAELLAWMPTTRHYLFQGELGTLAAGVALLEGAQVDWRLRQRVLDKVLGFYHGSLLYKTEFSFLARALIPHFETFLQEITTGKYYEFHDEEYEEDETEDLRLETQMCWLNSSNV